MCEFGRRDSGGIKKPKPSTKFTVTLPPPLQQVGLAGQVLLLGRYKYLRPNPEPLKNSGLQGVGPTVGHMHLVKKCLGNTELKLLIPVSC